jgi:hypothetical protein
MTLWTYDGAKASATYGGKLWYVADVQRHGKTMALTSVTIPGDEVKRAAATIKPEEMWAAQSGTSVTLDAGGLPGDISAKATAALRSKLEANGFKIADGQPIRVVATVEAGKPQEIQYRKFGESPFGGGTKISATPQTMKVAFVDAENKTLWQRQSTRAAPLMLSLKEGQSTEQAVAEATRPDAGFFENVNLPKFVAKAKYKNGLGTSNLTASGVSK